jgi:signal transduction histidine kinase
MNTTPEQTFGTAYRVSMTPLTESHGGELVIVGAVLVASDISEVEALELDLRKAQEEHSRLAASESRAQDASRLKSEFVANVAFSITSCSEREADDEFYCILQMSHEIRTPIAAMLGQAELLLEELDSLSLESGRDLKGGIVKILRSGEILLEVVSSVLDIGRIEVGKLQLEHLPFRLADVVSDALLFATAARKKGLLFNEDVDRSFFDGLLVGDSSYVLTATSILLCNRTHSF